MTNDLHHTALDFSVRAGLSLYRLAQILMRGVLFVATRIKHGGLKDRGFASGILGCLITTNVCHFIVFNGFLAFNCGPSSPPWLCIQSRTTFHCSTHLIQ